MRLRQLQYLLALQKYGSFSKTAEALFVSQPTISVSIRELEEELGAELLLRNYKGFTFTPLGLQVAQRGQEILNQVDAIYTLAAEQADLWEGSIRMGSTPHYCSSILLDVVVDLEKRYPRLHINLLESDSRSIVEQVKDGELDFGLIQLCDVEPHFWTQELEKGTITYRELFVEELCVSVFEGHPLGELPFITLQDLTKYPYGTYRKAMNVHIQQLMEQTPNHPRVIAVHDMSVLRMMLRRSECYTVIPRRAIAYSNALYAEKMLALNLRELSLASSVGLVCPSTPASRAVNYVQTALQARCREYQSM